MNQDNLAPIIAEIKDENTLPERLREVYNNYHDPDSVKIEDENTLPERLREVYNNYNHPDIKSALVSNPNTPLEILLELGEHYPDKLLANPVLDLYLMSNPNFFAEIPENTLISLLKLPQFPQEFVLLVLKHRGYSQKILITIFSIAREFVNQWARDNNIILNFEKADLWGANLSGANLSGVHLAGTNLALADLRGANLSGANLNLANLSGADLRGADLTKAKLMHADLTEANLNLANLSGADLTGADLTGADLTDADLIDANLTGAKLDDTTQIHNQ